MIKILDCAEVTREELFYRGSNGPDEKTVETVKTIIEEVRRRGDAALKEYALAFDKVKLENLRVTPEEFQVAMDEAGPELMAALTKAAENIRAFHSCQIREGFRISGNDGYILGQKITPIAKAGIYVPGGTASYPSTVLMDAIPAKLAGVERIVMVTPAGPDGRIAAPILAAASIAGVTDVYKTGGAQAIAALAYGTESIPKVDKIVGPGNIYVALAKQQVSSMVGIDMMAGPSEILIVADRDSDPMRLAADMLSQAEHDKLASAVLVCDSMELAKRVRSELERQLASLPRQEIAAASINNNGKIIVAADLAEAIDIANEIAPEHIELCLEQPFAWLDKIKNAGSIFLGRYTPEAVGDYWAGPNHTLPTLGTARFSSPLSVDDFIKKSSYVYFDMHALGKARDDIQLLARAEGLEAHARSIVSRFEEV
ncbi:MAG: histidinol dehydrogenase [Firmicutes bacterium]|nr:histidinol dehydrogenase [Bacillota bacterium]